jgi:hypothetical protein
MAASSTRSNGSLLPARGCQTQERSGREELRSTRRAVGEQPNVVLVDKLFGAFGVFLQAEVHDAAHADLLQEGQRLLRGVAASVYPVRDPEWSFGVSVRIFPPRNGCRERVRGVRGAGADMAKFSGGTRDIARSSSSSSSSSTDRVYGKGLLVCIGDMPVVHFESRRRRHRGSA